MLEVYRTKDKLDHSLWVGHHMRVPWGRPKKRESAQKKLEWSTKDWVSLFFSTAALITTLTLAYFTTLRVVDNVTIEFVPPPTLDYVKELERLYVPRSLNAIIVNSGTQPVVLKQMLLRAGKTCADYTAWLVADFEPFVVKDKEISLKKLTFVPNTAVVQDTKVENELTASSPFKPSESETVDACLYVGMSTPTNPDVGATIDIAAILIENGRVVHGLRRKSSPQHFQLFRSTSNILFKW